jgi:oxalate decarboxylase/phosphoglucose isomerase-like protein (cupin superfamily)
VHASNFSKLLFGTQLERNKRRELAERHIAHERKDAIMNGLIENEEKDKNDIPSDEAAPEQSTPPIDRRSFLARSTLVAGSMLAAPLVLSSNGEAAPAETKTPAEAEPTELPDFRFPLAQQPARELPGGSAREASAREFPVSKNIAGVLMTLKPGGLRELHWHANAAEWAYVIEGNVRITIVDPQGRIEIADFGPGHIWYFPRGHAHSIEGLGLGPGEAKFLLVFDNGYFSEFATFSFTDWLAQTPKEIVAKNLDLSVSDLKDLPKKEVYIAQGPGPAAAAGDSYLRAGDCVGSTFDPQVFARSAKTAQAIQGRLGAHGFVQGVSHFHDHDGSTAEARSWRSP